MFWLQIIGGVLKAPPIFSPFFRMINFTCLTFSVSLLIDYFIGELTSLKPGAWQNETVHMHGYNGGTSRWL